MVEYKIQGKDLIPAYGLFQYMKRCMSKNKEVSLLKQGIRFVPLYIYHALVFCSGVVGVIKGLEALVKQ